MAVRAKSYLVMGILMSMLISPLLTAANEKCGSLASCAQANDDCTNNCKINNRYNDFKADECLKRCPFLFEYCKEHATDQCAK
jgi:hypothetical protein